MNTIKFIIVVSIALLSTDLVYHQVVNGQNNSSSMVDKLIEDTKRDITIEQEYRAELINRIENSTCTDNDPTLQASMNLKDSEFMTIDRLEEILKQCVAEGFIK